TTALSMAFARGIAGILGIPLYKYINKISGGKLNLPKPMLNIINGGKHAGGKLAIQEFMIIPEMKTFKEKMVASSEVYHVLGKILVKKYGDSAKNIGDEGGYAPKIEDAEEAFEAIEEAIDETGYAGKIKFAIDSAASSFYDEKKEEYAITGRSKTLKRQKANKIELLEYYLELIKKYPIASIEDPFYEEDFEGFAELTKKVGNKCLIVGDDLLVTNPKRITSAIDKKSCTALLLKINQIGTVSEAIESWKMCKKQGWKTVVSHRSGETEDTFIADFAVGIGSEYIKTGAPARGERTAKYNQLLRIEEELTHKI
ncbi:MAG: phosphopyruvate hydratase, partial [Candidatus ainarchaeum sp.]|nr:phosphopyruvate hydratase [Candidatus ainarchaeum sp.]